MFPDYFRPTLEEVIEKVNDADGKEEYLPLIYFWNENCQLMREQGYSYVEPIPTTLDDHRWRRDIKRICYTLMTIVARIP